MRIRIRIRVRFGVRVRVRVSSRLRVGARVQSASQGPDLTKVHVSKKDPATHTLRFADSSGLPVSALRRRLAATASSIAAAYRSVSASELDR
jgi:hypothetical protein